VISILPRNNRGSTKTSARRRGLSAAVRRPYDLDLTFSSSTNVTRRTFNMPLSYRSPPWEEEEDNALPHLMRRHGLNDFFRVWTEMHAFHPTAYGRTSRTQQECVERYEYLLSPLNSDPVTTEESILIDDWVEKTTIRWPETKRRRGQGSNDAASRNRLYWSPHKKPSPLDTPEHRMLLQRKRLRKPGPKKTDRSSSITRRPWRVKSTGNGRLHFRSQVLGPETK
jgi:hypothetical protein